MKEVIVDDGEDLPHYEIGRRLESGFRNTDDSRWRCIRDIIDSERNKITEKEIRSDVLN